MLLCIGLCSIYNFIACYFVSNIKKNLDALRVWDLGFIARIPSLLTFPFMYN